MDIDGVYDAMRMRNLRESALEEPKDVIWMIFGSSIRKTSQKRFENLSALAAFCKARWHGEKLLNRLIVVDVLRLQNKNGKHFRDR